MGVRSYLWAVAVLVVVWSGCCLGHGRLIDPPSRASAWRYGFNTPHDYQDNEGNCGGFSYQYNVMGGRCGLCGDPWDDNPREHEAGGIYATGTIVRHYTEGQVIDVSVEITANHMGHFEFRICPNNNPQVEASQTCLNNHPLPKADGSGYYHNISSESKIFTVALKLPAGLTCTQCVFQWRYVAANSWGTCDDGTGQVGCGPQEEFRACADVAISSSGTQGTGAATGSAGSSIETTQSTKPPSTTRTTTTTTTTTTTKSGNQGGGGGGGGGGSGACYAVGAWQSIPGMDTWCENNCKHVPSFCPASHCSCD